MRIRADRLRDIVSVCESMVATCQSAQVSSERIFYAKVFFEKATSHGRSICAFIRRLKEHEESDAAGASALARSLIETHNIFLYLTEPGISRSEREFRYGLMQLNQAVDLLRISAALGAGSKDFVFWQETSKTWSIAELEKNQVFLSLDERQRAHLLRGKNPYLQERYKGPRAFSKEIESAAYNLFSHSVHSYGLSTSYAGSATPAGLVNMLFLAVEISAITLANLATRYRDLRLRTIGRATEAEACLIADALSLRQLLDWQLSIGDN